MKRAIIFGATGGIGKQIAQDLAKDGWSLYIHGVHQVEKAKRMCEELTIAYPQQDFLPLKLSFQVGNEELKKVILNLLPVNAVIFSQGITDFNFLGSQSLEKIDQIFQINVITPIKILNLLESKLMNKDHSRVIFIGSVYGEQASAMETVYSSTKGALSSFAQGYGREVASSHLTVNVIAPGAVATEMNSIFSEQTLEEVRQEIPAARLAKTSDISFWVKNILSPQADYFTGQTIYVDGGWLV
ncbi:SDR family oxidoreductase [Lactobacillus sp. PV037]|uniref:elongation factor P 5-aminopentanone reductase n=1 Tax=unclassified Lactobacillus TaxID=2620435 RepID=UPI00223F4B0E|nr:MULTISPECIES: SDR family oxidoreductase [unclassified Lactobacillus]QNQ82891.1 SDR family oxidoreductase [Lactobacillus sp. PV012]QNQ84422.1 SDR family oxidoreductase [Lactobacillus sp. PV037]